LEAGIDSLVLGCTHYPFLKPAIERIVGPQVSVIDPAPAVARQTGRVLARQGGLRQDGTGQVTYFTSGDPLTFQAQVHRLMDIPGQVRGVRWEVGSIVMAEGAARAAP
jgi:glutamate racemase